MYSGDKTNRLIACVAWKSQGKGQISGGGSVSVEIYGVEEESAKFRSIGVAGEREFQEVWQRAIDALKLRRIGNMVWLYQKDLMEILSEFAQVKEYFIGNGQQYFAEKAEEIGSNLQERWRECPEAERVWMG